MMSAKMGTVNDEDMIRMAFRVLSKDGSGTIKSSVFKHLMTHIGKAKGHLLLIWCLNLNNQLVILYFVFLLPIIEVEWGNDLKYLNHLMVI